jgi:hypothetical protein
MPAPNCITTDDFRRLENKVDSLATALIGNPSVGHRGIVPRLDALEVYQQTLAAERIAERSARRTAIAIASGVAAFVGAVGGIAAGVVKSMFTAGGAS